MRKENKTRILLVSHDASRTGAPILLLNLAAVLEYLGIEVHFLLKYGGQLEPEFRSKSKKCFVAGKQHTNQSLGERIIKRIIKVAKFDLSEINFSEYSLIISNTVTNGDILPLIRQKFNGTILSYIHELEQATEFFTKPHFIKALIQSSDEFIVPAKAVEKHLINNLGLSKERIHYLPYYIPKASDDLDQQRKEKSPFVIGSAGTVDWRKSPDLFIAVAKRIFQIDANVDMIFKWQGATEGVELSRLKYDLKKLDLEDKVQFLPATGDMNSFYKNIDLFILTSREDPYPLVVLEAAAAKVPCVCFLGAGGAPEFVEYSNSGKAVDYLDTTAAAETILHYFYNRDLLAIEGERAFEKLNQSHQNINFVSTFIQNLLNHSLASTINH